jgi:hypothetical protein
MYAFYFVCDNVSWKEKQMWNSLPLELNIILFSFIGRNKFLHSLRFTSKLWFSFISSLYADQNTISILLVHRYFSPSSLQPCVEYVPKCRAPYYLHVANFVLHCLMFQQCFFTKRKTSVFIKINSYCQFIVHLHLDELFFYYTDCLHTHFTPLLDKHDRLIKVRYHERSKSFYFILRHSETARKRLCKAYFDVTNNQLKMITFKIEYPNFPCSRDIIYFRVSNYYLYIVDSCCEMIYVMKKNKLILIQTNSIDLQFDVLGPLMQCFNNKYYLFYCEMDRVISNQANIFVVPCTMKGLQTRIKIGQLSVGHKLYCEEYKGKLLLWYFDDTQVEPHIKIFDIM